MLNNGVSNMTKLAHIQPPAACTMIAGCLSPAQFHHHNNDILRRATDSPPSKLHATINLSSQVAPAIQ